jgi:hypothetical protein
MSGPALLRALAGLLLALAALAPRATFAAENNLSCTYVVVSLPATLDVAGGTWCLTQDLATSISSGAAIVATADDVTLDCNHFIVDGSGAGTGTTAEGFRALGRRNVVLRNCTFRHFLYGANLDDQGVAGSGGHLVEDNVFRDNYYVGVHLGGDNSVLRRNRVLSTQSPDNAAFGIETWRAVDIVDNTVYHVEAVNAAAVGMVINGNTGGSVRGNRVRFVGLDSGTGPVLGMRIQNNSARMVVRGNVLSGDGSAGSIGIECNSATILTKSNSIAGYPDPLECTDNGNLIKP